MATRKSVSLSVFATFLLQFVVQVSGEFPICGVLSSRPNATTTLTEKHCIVYFSSITTLPDGVENAVYFPVSDALEWNVCNLDEPPPSGIEDHYIFLSMENNCSAFDQANRVQEMGGAGTLMVMEKLKSQEMKTDGVNVTLAFVENSSYVKIMNSGDEVTVGLYLPKDSPIHLSLIVIWFLAMFSVIVGAYWSGTVRHELYVVQHEREEQYNAVQEPVLPYEETSINMTVKSILGFVVLMCIMLLCLYFLYAYLVYIIIAMFCLASAIATYCCLDPLVSRMPCGTTRTPYFNIYIVRGTLMVRQILLLMFAFGLSITWVVLRKEPWAWILQDILGIMFSINVLKMIRLPSLKICTFLLCGLVIYDIFFVFITPLLTSDGKSIMVEVAKGGPSQEQMPMVLKVPNFDFELSKICDLQDNYNLLGFGDILIPGLLVSFVHSFDLQAGTPCRLYFIINIIGYGSGLVTTFIALWLMSFAQPALLYLVPFTLIPTFVTAAARGEFMAMWRGDSDKFDCEADADAVSVTESHNATNAAVVTTTHSADTASRRTNATNTVAPT
ncbi:signal peptide peptidase-like 2A isoform X1 [Penaeus japonicus]|uniref:signal peptide peptidase-like 2A isoform X1 n=1 Tax=Penaeus japonicus TaxID=27405 RepID=UPI001C70F8AA|nr:signal peptide peptidase-like 2A isoform X1 [Penaeus japonicus]